MGPPGREFGDIIAGELLQQRFRARPLEFDLPHVGDIKQPGLRPHRLVLVDDAAVLHRHVPAAERDHFRAEFPVGVVERCGFEGFFSHRGSMNETKG